MTESKRTRDGGKTTPDANNAEVMGLLVRRARDRSNSLKWNTNTLLLTYVILAATMILAIREVELLVLAIVAVVGLAVIWVFSRFQARRLEKEFLKEEVRAYSDLLSTQSQEPAPAASASAAAALVDSVQTPLTGRELEVLELIAGGRSNKEIAAELLISQQTVKNHISHIFAKLEISDRTSAVLLGMRHGWIANGPKKGEAATLDKET